MARKSKGGPSLLGVLLISGILTFTNAGNWLLTRLQGLSAQCSSSMPVQAGNVGIKICGGVSWAVNGVTEFAESVGGFFHGADDLKHKVANSIPTMRDRQSISTSVEGAFTRLASSGDRLNQMMREGPRSLTGGSVAQQFQHSVDSFTIGQHLRGAGDSVRAQAWFQQGAVQPNGFGVMSQLSLGDMYRRGGNGVQANYDQAELYYRQASLSLSQLSSNGSAQAQQMLRSLPKSVPEMQQQIAAAIEDAKRRKQ